LYTKLRKRGLAPATIRQVHAILRSSLNQAERWGLVQRNVAKLACAPSQPQREQYPPDVADVLALLAAARDVDSMFGLYVRVMVATGARRAEVCGLRWSDLDPATATLTVQQSYTLVPGVRGDRPTKTRSARTVALDPVTLDELEDAWMAASLLVQRCGLDIERRRTGYIFATDPTGESAWRRSPTCLTPERTGTTEQQQRDVPRALTP